jgi:hypothetical protein
MDKVPLIYSLLIFGAFNLPILVVGCCLPFVDQLGQALKEKSPIGGASDATSYSRITGLFGAVAVTAFFWAVGNVLLLKALTNIGDIKIITDNVGRFFLIGSALFMPYAFNQLKSAVSGTAAVLGASAAARAALGQPGPAAVSGTIPAVNNVDPQALNVTVMNLSSTIDDATLAKTLDAIQVQINRDFKPEWGVGANLNGQRINLVSGPVQVDQATDAIVYLADSTQDPRTGVAGLAGYHAENQGDVPYGFVYLDVCSTWKESWSCTLSHEILELIVDPTAAMTVAGPDCRVSSPNPPMVNYHLEVCDATNGDSYLINGVVVSNFVTKKYFGLLGASSETNQQQLTLVPFGARPGGYVQFDDGTGVNEVDGSRVDPARFVGRKMLGQVRRNARRASRLRTRGGESGSLRAAS